MKFFVLLLILILTFACSANSDADKKDVKDKKEAAKVQDTQAHFTATFLDGKPFDSRDYQGERLILAFFAYKHRDALPMLQHMEKIAPLRERYNFRIFAVSIDATDQEGLKKFLLTNGLSLPVLLETPALALAGKFSIENEVSFVGLGSDHNIAFGVKQYVFARAPDGFEAFAAFIKENLGIVERAPTMPFLGIHPSAPHFDFTTVDGKKGNTKNYLGKKAVLLTFFSPKCPHCQEEMRFLHKEIYPQYKDKGLEILALSVMKFDAEVKALYDSFKFTWLVVDDSTRAVRDLYSQGRGVPENFLIGKDGKIYFFSDGFTASRQNVYHMWVRRLLSLNNPPLLSESHYNGVETCLICHEAQYVSWSVTPHAHAWETLQIKGEDFNGECVQCHSLGFNEAQGYSVQKNPKTGKTIARVPEFLQNVQCENCHGIGGAHLAKEDMLEPKRLEKTCLTCHTEKFSLHFDFAERLKKVNHSDAAAIMQMPLDERKGKLAKVSKTPTELFGADKEYVGNAACATCHKDISDSWLKSVHIKGGEIVGKKFDDVGCESCHGPGEVHVKTKIKADIRGLGDDCPFCVVEQICLSCHQGQNDFNIHRGIEEVKKEHGI